MWKHLLKNLRHPTGLQSLNAGNCGNLQIYHQHSTNQVPSQPELQGECLSPKQNPTSIKLRVQLNCKHISVH